MINKKLLTYILLALIFVNSSILADENSSKGCPISELLKYEEARKSTYDVYSPVGKSTVKLIKQANRLTTLDNKTIAIVGGSFMANVTHPEIKRLILKNYPNAKVILLNEIGSSGPYPAPGVKRQQKDEFERKLKEMKVDAVISGNGGCGLCTPKEVGSCITAEHIAIPSVMIAAPGFVEQAKITALNAGIPVQRIAEYPGAFSSHTTQELIKNTDEILWKQIVEGLTKPITQQEIEQSTKKLSNSNDGVVFSGTFEEVQQFFETQGWSDGLTIVPPTESKINEFLKYTPYSKDTIIGNIAPSYNQITIQQVAITGIMAGCPPEYMPILVAFTKALTDSNFRKTLSSTHAWSPYIWLNGPIVRQLNIEFNQGEISSSANKKLGRFIDLAMLNLGGYDIKKNRMGTFGYLSSWAMAEDENATNNIGWQPYHVQKGFNINDNTLTATSALNWGNNLTPATSNPDKIIELMAWDIIEKEQFALGSGMPFVYRTIFITEHVAKDLAKKYKNKDDIENILIQTAKRPLDERVYANFWANPGSSFEGKNYSYEQHKSKIASEENAQITPTPKWLNWIGKNQIETVPVAKKGKTAIIITGDSNRNKVLTVPGGAHATIKIDLPSNWDTLTSNLGYKPITTYYLTPHTPTLTNTSTTTPISTPQTTSTTTSPKTINNPPTKSRPTQTRPTQSRPTQSRPTQSHPTKSHPTQTRSKTQSPQSQTSIRSKTPKRPQRPSAEKYRQMRNKDYKQGS